MKKIFKLYWPMFIAVPFFFLYGILIGSIFYGNALFENDLLGIVLVVFCFLFVIAIYGSMFYFMIKACGNKELKNKVLWCLALYFFNILVFSYFNLKHVCGEKKNGFKMMIFTLLSIVAIVLGVYITASVESSYSNKMRYIEEDDILIKISGKFRESEIGEYDFYLKDEKRYINFGGFVYDEDDNDTPSSILSLRDNWVQTTRSPAILVDNYTYDAGDSIINTNIYYGTNEGIKNIYYISTVEFKNTNTFVNTISTYLYEEGINYNDEIKQILIDMKYIEEKEL